MKEYNLQEFHRVIDELIVTLKNDVWPIVQEKNKTGGYFGTPRMIGCYINYLGLLYGGWDGSHKKDKKGLVSKNHFGTSDQAKKFISSFFSQVDPFYSENGDLFYEIYRHGTVHIITPKKMKANIRPKKTIAWLIYKGEREQWNYVFNRSIKLRHLQVIDCDDGKYYLPISINLLYEDLLKAIALYREDVESDQTGDLIKKFKSVAYALDNNFDETEIHFWKKAVPVFSKSIISTSPKKAAIPTGRLEIPASRQLRTSTNAQARSFSVASADQRM